MHDSWCHGEESGVVPRCDRIYALGAGANRCPEPASAVQSCDPLADATQRVCFDMDGGRCGVQSSCGIEIRFSQSYISAGIVSYFFQKFLCRTSV